MAVPTNFPSEILSLKSPDGGQATVSPYGAHVLSWVPADGKGRLFISPKAEYRLGVAIRGGVPVIFPQFSGMGSLPKHGFARTQVWDLVKLDGGQAVLTLSDNEQTRGLWNVPFLAEYVIRIANNQLEMTLKITNRNSEAVSFTAALHTYFFVHDLTQTSVQGLKGTAYRPSAGGQDVIETAEKVVFQQEVDRIYINAPQTVILKDAERVLNITSMGFPDAEIGRAHV